jgi:hypothetical protein
MSPWKNGLLFGKPYWSLIIQAEIRMGCVTTVVRLFTLAGDIVAFYYPEINISQTNTYPDGKITLLLQRPVYSYYF